MGNHFSRLHQLQHTLQPHQALLLSTPSDITYFTHFEFLVAEEREAFLCVLPKAAYLIKANFSPFPTHPEIQVKNNCTPQGLAQHLNEIFGKEKIQEVLIDESSLFVHEYKAVKTVALQSKVKITAGDKKEIWEMRMIKEPSEIELIRQACKITGQVWQKLHPFIKEGVTEKELSLLIESFTKELGGDSIAFPTIVAFGAGSAEPHYQPQNITLKENTPILIDFGVKYQGYRSDTTRTFWFGETPSAEFKKVETAIHAAYTAAKIQLTQPQHAAKDIDSAARKVLTDAGYAQYFIHTTGHGVGLDIHEPPSLNWSNDQEILPSMVITIEPGVYLQDKFGYRYENTIFITPNGPEELTLLP